VAGVVITMCILIGLRIAEEFIAHDRFGHLAITTHTSGVSDSDLRDRIRSLGGEATRFSMEYDLENKQRTLRCDIRYRGTDAFGPVEQLVTGLSQCRGVVSVDWKAD
jgi:hypothetical protein